jgi:hypothetical protein
MENITAVLEVLSLGSVKDSSEFTSTVLSHVQAEPRVLERLVPKLIDQVR